MKLERALSNSNKKSRVKISSSALKLIKQPIEYANGAIVSLQRDLENCKSLSRMNRLKDKIEDWKAFIIQYENSSELVSSMKKKIEEEKVEETNE